MLLGKPSVFSITALESSVVLEYSFAEFKKLVARHADIAAFYIRYMEQHWIIEKEPVEISLRHDSAKTRYARFSKEYPHLLKRLKQHHIAAFLGIAPESLSRIRKVSRCPLAPHDGNFITNVNASGDTRPYRLRHQPRCWLMTQTAKERFALELKWTLIYSLIYLAWMLAERSRGVSRYPTAAATHGRAADTDPYHPDLLADTAGSEAKPARSDDLPAGVLQWMCADGFHRDSESAQSAGSR